MCAKDASQSIRNVQKIEEMMLCVTSSVMFLELDSDVSSFCVSVVLHFCGLKTKRRRSFFLLLFASNSELEEAYHFLHKKKRGKNASLLRPHALLSRKSPFRTKKTRKLIVPYY